MPNEVDTNVFAMTYRDYSREVSTHRVATQSLTDAAAYNAAVLAYRNALNAITLGQEQSNSSTLVNELSGLPATSPQAAREDKWLIRYSDNVTGKIWRVTVPCRDDSAVTYQTNSDFVNLTQSPADTYVTAFEGLVASPDGNAVTVQSMERVGRNI